MPYSVPECPDAIRNAQSLRIYMDESWPAEKQDTGVLAGIVWAGDNPAQKSLPFIETHLLRSVNRRSRAQRQEARERQEQAQRAIERLQTCGRCFPFAMSIRVGNGGAANQYHHLVGACLQILLGWLLPAEGNKVRVSVFLEQFGGKSFKRLGRPWFDGLLAGAAQGAPMRFRRWHLEAVKWEGKNFEYIPYGDLLAYIALQHHKRAQQIANSVDFQNWPGRLPLSLELVPRLMRLDGLETAENVNDVLDLVGDVGNTSLGRFVLTDIQRRIKDRLTLQQKLLASLDERYRAKDRNLVSLRPQFEAVRQLVPEPKQRCGVRLDLLYTDVALQHANHDGDPVAVSQLVESYLKRRSQAATHDRELAAFVDLNLAIHYADRFDFAAAEKLLEDLHSDPSFVFLAPLTRGWVHSSLGQCCAMQGRHLDADKAFRAALQLYEKADLSDEAKKVECDQTKCYQAINAMDGGFDTAAELVEEVLGEPLAQAAKNLTGAETIRNAFHHHLLLRLLWMQPQHENARDVYLSHKEEWHTGIEHPWPLIDCYRALLLWQRGLAADATLVKQMFDRSIDGCVMESHHGITLALIGAMVSTVARCCNRKYGRGSAQELFQRCRKEMPKGVNAVKTLQPLFDAPRPEHINTALAAAPFYYH